MPHKTLFIIDGHALCYRSFYAIKNLSNSKGQPTNAVYGFIGTVRKILKEHQPEYMVVCFDSKEKTHRESLYKEYKIQRPKMPDDLISQIPLIKKLLNAFQITSFERPGYEADDLIATLVKKGSKDGFKVVVVSDDKDLYQLAGEHISFFSPRKNEMYDTMSLKEKLGFLPERMADFIALAGDASDNIPGVKGVGKVTAGKLINEFGTLENVFNNLEKIEKESLRKKLEEHKSEALLSKELAVLEEEMPLDIQHSDFLCNEPDRKKVFELFKELEFRRLADEYSDGADSQSVLDITLIDGTNQTAQIIKAVQSKNRFAFYADYDQEKYYLACDEAKAYELGPNLKDFREIFENPKIIKIVFNLKSVLKFLEKYGIFIKDNTFDCMLASYLLGQPQSRLNIGDLAWDFLKYNVPQDQLTNSEAFILYNLYGKLQKQLKESKLNHLLENIEEPLSYVLYAMEKQGIPLDTAFLKELSKKCQKKIDALIGEIHDIADGEFNINSPKQLSHVLFEKLNLPVVKKTKTGFSTNEEVLRTLAEAHELPLKVLEYRQLAKLQSTYIEALPKLVDSKTNRLHAEFDQIGTETGRLSSRNPNMQNIPIRTDLGRQIRKAITASGSDNILIAADYSQIELRILAHLTHDEGFLKAFRNNEDIHTYTASLIFDIDEKDVDYHKRDTAKRVNFGIIYGMSAFGLAKDLGVSRDEAQQFIDRYFLRYPKVQKFMKDTIKSCEENGYVKTLLDRRRYIPEIKNSNNAIRQYAQRQAINTPVQGSAADLIKLAMINIKRELDKEKYETSMILTVHDELVFDGPKDEQKKVVDLVRNCMEGAMKLAVPVSVSIKAGPNWLEMEEING